MGMKILDGYGYGEGIPHPPAHFVVPGGVGINDVRMMYYASTNKHVEVILQFNTVLMT